MFKGSNYFTVFLPYAGDVPSSQVTTTAGAGCRSVLVWQQSWRTERHQLKEAAHRTVQPMPEAT